MLTLFSQAGPIIGLCLDPVTHLLLCTYSMWVILSDKAAMTQNSLKFTFLLPVRFNIYKKTDQR